MKGVKPTADLLHCVVKSGELQKTCANGLAKPGSQVDQVLKDASHKYMHTDKHETQQTHTNNDLKKKGGGEELI